MGKPVEETRTLSLAGLQLEINGSESHERIDSNQFPVRFDGAPFSIPRFVRYRSRSSRLDDEPTKRHDEFADVRCSVFGIRPAISSVCCRELRVRTVDPVNRA